MASDSEYMSWEDIGRASEAWRVASGAPGSPYDEFRDKFLPLPDWFDQSLDPFSQGFLAQQDRLWQMMVGTDSLYNSMQDEITADSHIDPVVRPGLYSAPTVIAGDHLIALGHLLKYSETSDSSRVLEYGAGFAQIALTFARRGAEVHTVDIDDVFCDSVEKQAKFFGVNLTPHKAEFGYNPGGQFDLILFYESFHHARTFVSLVAQLRKNLRPGAKVMMAGEPIIWEPESKSVPYPWGIRLEAEVASIVRFRRWYELGIRKDFLVSLFEREGFAYTYRPGFISPYADIHEFKLTAAP